MNDRELLEKAAKAAGCKYMNNALWDGRDVVAYSWNPLTDDGDALRLAVKLGLTIDMVELSVWHKRKCVAAMPAEGDPYAATRRAIVRAAAEIGKEMKYENT